MAKKSSKSAGGRRGFPKGRSGNPAGRKPGVPNKVTREAKELCLRMVNDRTYQKRFWRAFIARTLSEKLETLVWHYAFGKPVATVNVGAAGDLAELLAMRLSPPQPAT